MSNKLVIAENILQLIGNTPLVRLNRIPEEGSAEVLVKLEAWNPMASVKDRIGVAMIEAAEKAGKIKPGENVIVEPTSGNTGIALAMVCAVKGYELILTMPETMTPERIRVLRVLGAKVELTPGPEGMPGAVCRAEAIVKDNPGSYMPQQFKNPANPNVHRETTAKEILKATAGDLNAFVAGVGTGGTVTGCGEVLKAKNKDILVVAVEPDASPVLSGGAPGSHKIQGIGAGFIPDVLNRKILDRVVQVSYEDARDTSRRLAREEGIFVGISAGANVFASLGIASELGKGKRIVTIGCDFGERYLSHDIFAGLDAEA
jgi:cysteine synthase A